MEELEGIDSAHERLRIVGRMARFVRAPHMRNVAELLGHARNLLFIEALLGKEWLHPSNVTLHIEHLRRRLAAVMATPHTGRRCRWNQTRTRRKECPLPFPIPLLTSGP